MNLKKALYILLIKINEWTLINNFQLEDCNL